MLTEIIRELTKAEERTAVTTEQVYVWAKRVEAQRYPVHNNNQSKKNKGVLEDKDNKRGTETQCEKTTNMCQNLAKAELQLLWFQPSTQTMPILWEKVCRV